LTKYGDWHYKNIAPYNRTYDSTLAGKYLYTCGLMAQTFFTDRFYDPYFCTSYQDPSTCRLLEGNDWKKEGIAWDSDLSKRFFDRPPRSRETNKSPRGIIMPHTNDEEFVVWMRAAASPTFTKLYRILNVDDVWKKGTRFQVTIDNTYPSWLWKGEKAIVLSTLSFLGGKDALGVIHVVVGIICLVAAFFFWIQTRKMDAEDFGKGFDPKTLGILPKKSVGGLAAVELDSLHGKAT